MQSWFSWTPIKRSRAVPPPPHPREAFKGEGSVALPSCRISEREIKKRERAVGLLSSGPAALIFSAADRKQDLHVPKPQTPGWRNWAVVKSTIIESNTSPSAKRFESKSSVVTPETEVLYLTRTVLGFLLSLFISSLLPAVPAGAPDFLSIQGPDTSPPSSTRLQVDNHRFAHREFIGSRSLPAPSLHSSAVTRWLFRTCRFDWILPGRASPHGLGASVCNRVNRECERDLDTLTPPTEQALAPNDVIVSIFQQLHMESLGFIFLQLKCLAEQASQVAQQTVTRLESSSGRVDFTPPPPQAGPSQNNSAAVLTVADIYDRLQEEI
ncbi:hypothetical protein E1301_Tti000761 [Triplophysa tibetana]|uniref:Uncharacterized protein n=1 Tax=Triplophysa tibetana TaxID=1572043 RepID=A0A5A9N4H8_9TELE|nr:hypothetical protein E1301_Tti000761 [Triplophysa tibetana]